MMNKSWVTVLLAWLLVAATISNVDASSVTEKIKPPVAHYLLKDAPVFDTTLQQFRTQSNEQNPQLPIQDYLTITLPNDSILISRTVSKITAQLYSSVVIDKNSEKIKSFQLTYLPTKEADSEKAAYAIAIDYMSAAVCWFNMVFSQDQCKTKVLQLLSRAHEKRVYQQMDGAVRYIVVDQAEQGITLAIEPVKLTLAEPKSTSSISSGDPNATN